MNDVTIISQIQHWVKVSFAVDLLLSFPKSFSVLALTSWSTSCVRHKKQRGYQLCTRDDKKQLHVLSCSDIIVKTKTEIDLLHTVLVMSGHLEDYDQTLQYFLKSIQLHETIDPVHWLRRFSSFIFPAMRITLCTQLRKFLGCVHVL